MKRLVLFFLLFFIPVMVMAKPPLAPDLSALHQFKPTNPVQAFTFHQQILQQRIDHLEQNNFLPEKKKAEVIAEFTDELTWLEEKQAALKAATTKTERQAISQEIIDHVQTQRQERTRSLVQDVTLPARSPVVSAQHIADQFTSISERFRNNAVDTAELDAAIQEYTTTITALEQALSNSEEDKTIEHIRALRDAIVATREAAREVRNQVQSILMQFK